MGASLLAPTLDCGGDRVSGLNNSPRHQRQLQTRNKPALRMIGQYQTAAMALCCAARNRQAQTMPGRRLARCPVERLAQLTQRPGFDPRSMVAHTDHDPLALQ